MINQMGSSDALGIVIITLACVFAHASATFTELGDREGDLSIVLRHAGVGADLVVFTTFV